MFNLQIYAPAQTGALGVLVANVVMLVVAVALTLLVQWIFRLERPHPTAP